MKTGKKTLLYVVTFIAFITTVLTVLTLGHFMNKQGYKEIHAINNVYMKGMGDITAQHFGEMLEVHLSQVNSLKHLNSPNNISSIYALKKSLIVNSKIFGFDYVGFVREDGAIEMVFGEQITLKEPLLFINSIKNGEQKAAGCENDEGKNVIVFGVPAKYPLSNGRKSVALIAGFPSSYFIEKLALNDENSLVYFQIIRRNGTYIIRNREEFSLNYYQRLQDEFKNNEDFINPYIKGLQSAMEKGITYSDILVRGYDEEYIYCTKIPKTEWYLLTILPYGTLNQIVNTTNAQNYHAELVGLAFIVIVFIAVFILYMHFSNVQLREVEKARQEAIDANKAKSEFLSNMSHDIRTPMNAIQGMTAIALLHLDNIEQVKNCLKKISISGKHLLGLINDILDMSKIESGRMVLNEDRTSLREIMESVVTISQPQMKEKNQKFEVTIKNIISENVMCDGMRFNQVLLNLMGNAIKYTQDNGSINLSMSQEESSLGDDYVQVNISVSDTGIGMSQDFQEKIFESFVREDNARVNKIQGTGLGMAITKYIVDAMKGKIWLKSELGKGSEFFVSIDMKKAAEKDVEKMHFNGGKILVVDDDKDFGDSVIETLTSMGVNADWSVDGIRAFEKVKEQKENNEKYDVIIMDWQLPNMDGIEAAKKIKKIIPETQIILTTAYDWLDVEERAKEAGIVGFISKPLFKSTLYYGLRPYFNFSETKSDVKIAATENINIEGCRVLLAEDNELNKEVAEELLLDRGITMEWAENGQIAVEKFQSSPNGYYNAVLMDIRMPVMDGYEATKKIRALDRNDANLPIIAMTADAFAEDMQRCIDSGMDAHIPKPLDMKKLIQILNRLLSEKLV